MDSLRWQDWKFSRAAPAMLGLALGALSGCDPILEVDGAFFPAWLICMIGAGFMLGGIRWIIFRTGIEPFIGPRVTVYFCVYLTCTLALWLGFFRL